MPEEILAHEGRRGNPTQRGEELYRYGAITRISGTVFIVAEADGSDYLVKLQSEECDCDPVYIEGQPCEHLIAARLYSEWLRYSAQVLAPFFGEGGA